MLCVFAVLWTLCVHVVMWSHQFFYLGAASMRPEPCSVTFSNKLGAKFRRRQIGGRFRKALHRKKRKLTMQEQEIFLYRFVDLSVQISY